MTYRNETDNIAINNKIFKITHVLSDIYEKLDDVYTKQEVNDFLVQDNINEDNLYYTKDAIAILLNNKVNTSTLTNYYNTSQIDTLMTGKVNISALNNYYNTSQINSLMTQKVNISDLTNYYNTSQISSLMTQKVNISDLTATNTNLTNNYYTTLQIDSLMTGKVNISTLNNYYNTSQIATLMTEKANTSALNNYYNTSQIDSLMTQKVNISTLNNYYNTSQISSLMTQKVNISELTNYYNTSQIATLMTQKVNTSELTATNTNLTNNYYNKSQIDSLITNSNGNVDLSNYYNTSQINSLMTGKVNTSTLNNYNTSQINSLMTGKVNISDLTNYYTKTETNNEISTAIDSIAPVIVPWHATLNTNSFNYPLPYDGDFVDTTSTLNVTSSSYNIVPAKKIHSFVTSSISSKANSSDLTTTNSNVTTLSNNLSSNYYNKTQVDGMVGGGGSSIYYRTLNNNVTTTTTGYQFFTLTLTDSNPPSGKLLYILEVVGAEIGNWTDSTGYEDVNKVYIYVPFGMGSIDIQLGHSVQGGKTYNFQCIVFFTYINPPELSTASSSLALLNYNQAIRDHAGNKNYLFDTVPLSMQFEDANTEWKTFSSRVILEQVKENMYWCTVTLNISDTFPTNREKETILKLPFDFASVPTVHTSCGTCRFTVQGYSHNTMYIMQRISNHTNGNSYRWVYLMLPSSYNDNIWISPKGWPSNFNQGMNFTMDGSFRYLCDITKNNYLLQIL